jgi:hypothetical protein
MYLKVVSRKILEVEIPVFKLNVGIEIPNIFTKRKTIEGFATLWSNNVMIMWKEHQSTVKQNQKCIFIYESFTKNKIIRIGFK